MARIDHLDNPDAPPATSIVPATTSFVQDDQGRVLLIRRTDNGRWAIPGGAQEFGEFIAETAVRETLEESGIETEVTGIVGIYTNPQHKVEYSDGEVRQQFSICFRARPVGGELRPSDESSEVAWFAASDLDSLDIHPAMRMRIEHGFAHRPDPYIG